MKKVIVTLSVAGLLITSSAAIALGNPNVGKNCPGSDGYVWGWYVSHVLNFFGVNPGEHIAENC